VRSGSRSTARAEGSEAIAPAVPAAAPKRIVIAAGGTAGHVVPAIAVAQELRAEGAEVSFIGGERAEAQLVPAAGFALQAIHVEGLSRSNPLRALRDLERYQTLHQANPKAVSQTQLDQIVTAADNAKAQREAAEEQVRGAAAQMDVTRVQITGAAARLKTLQAQVQEAQLNVGYTRIVAPFAGHVTQKSVALGSYVAPGQQLMALVPLDLWVTANFKETQLALMRPSQSVEIAVDACPNIKLSGHVDSIQRGSGQAFALLPPENATGNFVKVVQRVPVKIILDRIPRDCVLGPGMSVEPRVQVR